MNNMNNMNNLIEELLLDSDLIKKLHSNNILSINDLWVSSRKDLKRMKLTDNEINTITIKMQLLVIDLNKKVYHDK